MLSHWSMGVFRWEYVNMVVTLQIFVVYVLSDAHFDWLVGNMNMIKKIYFDQEVNKQHFPSFVNLVSRNSLQKQQNGSLCLCWNKLKYL